MYTNGQVHVLAMENIATDGNCQNVPFKIQWALY